MKYAIRPNTTERTTKPKEKYNDLISIEGRPSRVGGMIAANQDEAVDEDVGHLRVLPRGRPQIVRPAPGANA